MSSGGLGWVVRGKVGSRRSRLVPAAPSPPLETASLFPTKGANLTVNGEQPSSRRQLEEKLATLNPDTDCVAILQPNHRAAVHIPDAFVRAVQAGKELPPHIMSALIFVHLYKHFRTDPAIIEFVERVKQQVLLELAAEGNSYDVAETFTMTRPRSPAN